MTWLRAAVGVAISLALLASLLWTVDLKEVWRQIQETAWGWTLVSAALAPIGLWIRARRWRYLFPPRSEPPALVPAMMIGYMVNNILPLRAGEIVRVYVVARRWGRGFWTALATLVVERVLDSLVLVLILGVLIFLIPVPATLRWAATILVAIDVIAVAMLSVLAVAPDAGERVLRRATRRWPGLGDRGLRVFRRFVDGLDGIRAPGHLLPLALWTVVVWLAPAAAAWVMFRAMHLDLSWLAAWTVLAFVGVGISIPAAPGYVGVFHYAAVLALQIFDVPRPAALGYALVFHASTVLTITVVGWVFLLREHLSLGEATHVRPEPDRPP
ncbi:MAG TPA: lysylphosphatidylglycerol synthase transmembrane domain-containing protein [Methylomirabilota bacterium]